MSDVGLKLVSVHEVVFEGNSGAVSARAEGTAMKSGVSTE